MRSLALASETGDHRHASQAIGDAVHVERRENLGLGDEEGRGTVSGRAVP